jgi:hypothetical protein
LFLTPPFVAENWTPDDQDEQDAQLWEEDWDEEDVNDDFTKQLRYIFVSAILQCQKQHFCSNIFLCQLTMCGSVLT